MNKKIIIIAGDPNSINSELIYKTWRRLSIKVKKNVYLIANLKLIKLQFKKLRYKLKLIKVNDLKNIKNSNVLKIIDVPLNFNNPFKVSSIESSKYVIRSLDLAHQLTINKKLKGIINCPINKKLIKKSNKIGVTEYLASKCNINNHSEVMMIRNKKLSVVPITTHIRVKDVPKAISTNLIVKKIKTLTTRYKIIFGKIPKLGVLGLNPHNAEYEKDSEEIRKIIPAISILKKAGLNISWPLVSDTIFINNYKKYDVIVGMYHDQVLGPFKTMFHFDAINITLGLKYIRVSPDHGPAYDLIGKNKSNSLSLYECVRFVRSIK